MRLLDVPVETAVTACQSIPRFIAALTDRGVDPSQYPELVERRKPGPAPSATKAKSVRRRAIRNHLRELGFTTERCVWYQDRPTQYEKLMAELGKEPRT